MDGMSKSEGTSDQITEFQSFIACLYNHLLIFDGL